MEKIITIEKEGGVVVITMANKIIINKLIKEMENIIDLHPGLIVGFAVVIFIMLLLIVGILIKKPMR
jgi:hypothetical protein